MSLIKQIFSIRNNSNRTCKIITVLGLSFNIKFKKSRRDLELEYLLEQVDTMRHYVFENVTRRNYDDVRLRLCAEYKKRKIRVLFLVNEISKWKVQSLYDLIKESEDFEPIIALNIADRQWDCSLSQRAEIIKNNYEFFKSKGMDAQIVYDAVDDVSKDLAELNPDIVFYQQPYWLAKEHRPELVSEYALTCYIPYYVPNYSQFHLYCKYFHEILFRYYQPNKEWESVLNGIMKHKAGKIMGLGHTALDVFNSNENKEHNSKENYVIYAPHWSIKHKGNVNSENYSTFLHNGVAILNYAKAHPEINWVFKPHPTLKNVLLKSGAMSKRQVENYYNQWSKIGKYSCDSDYADIFLNSKALITDCGSFLVEYFCCNKPLIHLIPNDGLPDSIESMQDILGTFYKVHNLDEMYKVFDEVLVKNKDVMAPERAKVLKEQSWVTTNAAENILNDLRSCVMKK